MTVEIYTGDCLEIMRTLEANSIDAVVTDPPYGIGFMGKAWDGKDIQARIEKRRHHPSHDPGAWSERGGHKSAAAGRYDLSPKSMRAFQAFSAEWAAEALRVAKPGAHCVAFASPRTFHRLVCGLEDAGWEIRDTLMWVFGSGFPKSHNGDWGGTALKPAWEPIVLARKPLDGTVEANWRKWGTGALNIDACRIETAEHLGGGAYVASGNRTTSPSLSPTGMNRPGATAGTFVQPAGRWPANLIHDGSEEVLAAFPVAPGQLADASQSSEARKSQNCYGAMRRGRVGEPSADSANKGVVGFGMTPGARRLDAGTAARFYYCAKSSKADRGEGNDHPTVKPTLLMRWLCRLVTPPHGVVLDPFSGSGSTGCGAVAEGFGFIAIEKEPQHVAVMRARLAVTQPGLSLGVSHG